MSGAVRTPRRREGRLLDTIQRSRVPSPGRIARRRWTLTLTKLLLPAVALALLGSLALWPEFRQEAEQANKAAKLLGEVHGDTVFDARYRSVDQQGRPFTITAARARRLNDDQVDLVQPKGHITLQDGTWLMLQSAAGTYRQHADTLDLTQGVTLYRDDGTTMVTKSATVDLKSGAAAGTEPVHATGPFGTLDAQGGFTAVDSGQQIFFAGPASVRLNAVQAPPQ